MYTSAFGKSIHPYLMTFYLLSYQNPNPIGTEQYTCCFDVATELNARSSTTVYDKQIQSSQTSAQHLPRSSGSGKMVASFKSDVQSTVSHLNRSYGVQTQVDSSCERVLMNCQSSCNASLVPQYSQSHYLENNLDKASNSLPTYSNTLSDGDACYISKVDFFKDLLHFPSKSFM
jgi:hypothetical protein